MPTLRYAACVTALSLGLIAPRAAAQDCETVGPDLILGNITSAVNYSNDGFVDAFAFGQSMCNIGDVPIDFFESNRFHPIVAQNLFKLHVVGGATRFEQLGQAWPLHSFFALSQANCCADCVPTNGQTLGVHCSSPNSGITSGTPGLLGPKWQINPHTGVFPFPPASPAYAGTTARRLQARLSELEPSSGFVRYFVEIQFIAPDEALAGNDNNNSGYREVALVQSGGEWNATLMGPTVRTRAAVEGWADLDEGVALSHVQIPDDGLLIVGGKVTSVAGGLWRYEYALQNLNSDRAVQAFAVPLASGVSISNIGFHDVDYHSGDGPGNVNFSGVDWLAERDATTLKWATQTFAENASANAIRWGTLYNFRFDADRPPVQGEIALTLFKPGSPATVSAAGLPIPANIIAGDVDADGDVDLQDLSSLLSSFGLCAGDPAFLAAADFNASGCIDLNDLATLLSAFGAP